jgi:ATP-binding cassette subfamily F protein 3
MIRLTRATFSFGHKPILEDVSLLVPQGSRVGLIGRNGAGKTTLFRLLLGELAPDSGELEVPRQSRLVYLPQHPATPPRETILHHVLESHPSLHDLEDQILRLEQKMAAETSPARLDRLVERHRSLGREFEAEGGYELEARVASILEALGFERHDLLQPIETLSPGEKNRVALAKVLLAEGDVLLLDEPTNHLDFDSVEWLESYLLGLSGGGQRAAATVLVASHDRWFLNRVADHILELRSGGAHLYRGNYDDFARQRAEEIEHQEKEFTLQQRQIEKDLEFIRRNFAAQKARQAKSREKRLERLERLERPEGQGPGPVLRFRNVPRSGDIVLRVEDAACGYGETSLLRGVGLELERGDRVAILGPNGSGKTTLLKCIVGRLGFLAGTCRVGQRVTIGYYEQEPADLSSDRSLFDEVHDLVPQWTNQEVRDLLAAFLFRGDEILQPTRSMSGGEKARVALLRLLLSGANFLVLDEPTNHLDIYARAALEEALLGFPGTILFVSHDRYFVERLADRVGVVHEGGWRQLPGGYEAWRQVLLAERQEALARQEAARRAPRAAKAAAPPAPGPAQQRRAEERLLVRITEAEAALEMRRQACGEEANYRNPEAMRRLKVEIASLEAEIQDLYGKWESLSST